ncbi:FAD-binding dehydrogenase [Mycolicibacterium duvalii]|uniref:KsdD-like steroid dehydrogenase n=1 Tax=Mycolicibacterium duvalii TaxID=39688 RepID=A0A7I7K876_9MYCO|nr:FAD-binding dehydrogenase [Mycolicibacterium duvalii]MCV7366378.1 FAD-binding dehydrogenase [Mycolicibacterium duvalii]PEG43829.1 FAD-binding dehydrogenase [Mycolicibacterium duvalii]BBX20207.1 KsdD-like steroid dehydrogenase [Mycolicibacterium duvalii]
MADADVIVVGAGLAGLVAACELADRGRSVLIVDQENAANIGGQAYWSFGGLFFVDSPEQRRLGIRDSHELALQDWLGTAGFDRAEDHWPRQWAQAYVDFAAGEKRRWLRDRGLQTFALVGWAERGGYDARGHGNSVPRFHITWGTGPALVDIFARRLSGRPGVRFAHRHRVDELLTENGAVVGVRGAVLQPSAEPRGVASSREVAGDFELRAQAVIVASGGIGGNHDLVRKNWPARMGRVPEQLLSGVPAHVDGRMLGISEAAGAHVINSDRMWHYTEGITNYDPIWPRHGIRILPGPSSLWLDANGKRLPAPLYPGFDTLGTLEYIARTGHDYTWFVLNKRIIDKEFGLSGQEQNPDLTGRSLRGVLDRSRNGPAPVHAFVDRGVDFVSANTLRDLVTAMNAVPDTEPVDYAVVEAEVTARDREVVNRFTKDSQITAVRAARNYLPDRISRVVAPHRLTEPKAGPLIAVKLHILTRKSLGGLETDLDSRALRADGSVLPGLYAAGEAAGFGGGGLHGYRSLEGTFLGGCVFSGRAAGRAAARDVG